MYNLEINLKNLKKYGLVGIKQSLEDEGAGFEDIRLMRKITKKLKLNLNVKIGGCEAKNDIFFCDEIKVDGIVAPMVESKYALQKFINTTIDNFLTKKVKIFFNLETIQAYKNFSSLSNLKEFNLLSGIVIGRSDLAGSLSLLKNDVNSKKIFKIVNTIASKIKKKNISIKMGGSITPKSLVFIKKLYLSKKLFIIETRNCEFRLNDNLLSNFENVLISVFKFEIAWLEFKNLNINKKKSSRYFDSIKRIKEIKKRLKNYI